MTVKLPPAGLCIAQKAMEFSATSLSLSRMHPYLYTRAVPLCLRPAFFNGMTWNFKQKWLIESIPGSAFLLNLSDY